MKSLELDLPEKTPEPPGGEGKPGSESASLAVRPAAPEPWTGALASLPPMPPGPASDGALDALRYLVPVGRAWLARWWARHPIERDIADEQDALDGALAELGRVAREEGIEDPEIAPEMKRLEAEEARRGRVHSDAGDARKRLEGEMARLAAIDGERRMALAEQEVVVEAAAQVLAERAEARRTAQAQLAAVEERMRRIEQRVAAAEARRASATGAGLEQLDREILGARAEAMQLTPEREGATVRLVGLDREVAEHEAVLGQARAESEARARAVAAVEEERTRARAAFVTERRRLEGERVRADAVISRQRMAVGTLVNLKRVDRDTLRGFYARIDKHKQRLGEREATLQRLDEERLAHDHAAVQRGLITLGAVVAGLILLALGLVFLTH